MRESIILVCADPAKAHWRLGPLPPPEGHILLVGWRLSTNPVDSGVPAEVAATLARALTSIARVSFPVSGTDRDTSKDAGNSDDRVRVLGSGGLVERAEAAFKHEPPIVTLLSTREPKTAARLFEDAAYPWRLQGQVALLSARNAGPPQIDRKALLSLIDHDWATHAAQCRSSGIVGVLRPGVDGDVAGLLTLNDEFKQAVLDALKHEAQHSKLNCLCLSEDDFINMLGEA